ncbi:MAG: EAL domain-containing protein [Gammaproteobacteria bacterium]|nr:MAG: EAL domain-containing protein [Gammaproteobacteria bacterium]
MKNPLKEIDYIKFSQLITHLNSNIQAFSACDANGNVFWLNVQSYKESINEVTGELHKNIKRNLDNSDQIYFRSSVNSESLYHIVLFDLADRPCGGLSIIVKSDSNKNKKNKTDEESLELIASLVSKERALLSELSSMAYELEERYEELNLVYDTDDQSSGLVNGPEVLQNLVQNCTDYLDVAMAVLIMPREDLTIFHHNTKYTIHYVHSMLLQVKNNLFPWLEENGKSLVMNDLSDALRDSLIPDVPYKIACSPILITNEEVSGMLVTLNPNYARDFSNSDRNLLETMARKAAKVTMANYDSLTGLLKRNGFEYLLESALNTAQSEGKTFCILHIDIDGVKVVNDTADTKAGDQLIVDVGKQIREKIRDTDSVARLTGDKYGVLLDSCSLEMGCSIADNIRLAIQEMGFSWDDQSYETSACIGVAEMNADCESIQSIFAAAELAVNVAKEQGRNLVQVYQSGDTQLQRRKGEVHWVRRLQKALVENGLELFCQLIQPIDNSSNTLHFEILLRMKNEDGSIVPPIKFLPAAERFRLMPNVDAWVIENSFKLLMEASTQSNVFDYIWTINLSGQSMNEPNIVDLITSLSDKYQVSPEIICFEVTETVAVNNLQDAKHLMGILRDQGFRFALDDFGSGLSSFAYLKNLPVDYLKIDGSFIKGIVDDPFTHEIVRAINQVSQVRGLETIAEFVENEDIIRCIKDIGINYAQGYGVGKPIPLSEQLNSLQLEKLRFVS